MFWRKKVDVSVKAQLESLEVRMRTVMAAIAQLTDDIDKQEARHKTLEGRIYAKKLHKPDAEDAAPDTARMSRDELRRWATQSGRIIPGRPAVHKE